MTTLSDGCEHMQGDSMHVDLKQQHVQQANSILCNDCLQKLPYEQQPVSRDQLPFQKFDSFDVNNVITYAKNNWMVPVIPQLVLLGISLFTLAFLLLW